ncbi:MAG: hypothetical protein LBU65_16785 [Planctomycetaceae bacterium]|jgi:hypothetical protein|nr:hypothetical protein [Planctomycetaceae bacterium]
MSVITSKQKEHSTESVVFTPRFVSNDVPEILNRSYRDTKRYLDTMKNVLTNIEKENVGLTETPEDEEMEDYWRKIS